MLQHLLEMWEFFYPSPTGSGRPVATPTGAAARARPAARHAEGRHPQGVVRVREEEEREKVVFGCHMSFGGLLLVFKDG
jgi:hypothetical protein